MIWPIGTSLTTYNLLCSLETRRIFSLVTSNSTIVYTLTYVSLDRDLCDDRVENMMRWNTFLSSIHIFYSVDEFFLQFELQYFLKVQTFFWTPIIYALWHILFLTQFKTCRLVPIMSNFCGQFFHVFMGKKKCLNFFWKYCSNRTKKLHRLRVKFFFF